MPPPAPQEVPKNSESTLEMFITFSNNFIKENIFPFLLFYVYEGTFSEFHYKVKISIWNGGKIRFPL